MEVCVKSQNFYIYKTMGNLAYKAIFAKIKNYLKLKKI